MKITKAFETAYKELNNEQKLAVDTLDGPIMVVAGPGTGKTQTLALRIANILLKTDTDPDAILALTFTESAAKEMRERLTRFIGAAAYYINISTFHSFCVDVIKTHPSHFTIDPSVEPLSDLEKLKILRRLIDHGKWQAIKPHNAPYHYVRAAISSIADLKRENISTQSFRDLLERDSLELEQEREGLSKTEFLKRTRDLVKNRELASLYEEYEKELSESNNFDFEDMISHVTRAFKADPDFLLTYQERFHYFLVDEYQDTNSAQNEVINLLASYYKERSDVFVVGDPDQAIMRFQGASIENQLSFVRRYQEVLVITLRQNYRSAQPILDAAYSLISHNELRIDDVVEGLDSRLVGNLKDKSSINLVTAPSSILEDLYLVRKIKELEKSGTLPEEIVVIYRNNLDGQILSSTLAKFGIDYVVQGGGNVLAEPVVKRFLKILRVVDELRRKEDDIHLFTILNYDIFGIDPLDVLKISRCAADNKATLFDVIADRKLLDKLNLRTADKVVSALSELANWQDLDANNTFVQFFEQVLTESGYLKSVLDSPDVHNQITRLNTLFEEVKKMNRADHDLNLRSFLDNLDLMEQNNLRIEEGVIKHRKSAITLTTAHSAKGLEWKHVFVYRLFDGQWGNKRNSDLFHLPPSLVPNTDLSKKEKNEDERRLFYVALTRAKTHLYLVHAASYSLYGRSRQVAPSMFLFELGDEFNNNNLETPEEDLESDLYSLLAPAPKIEGRLEKEQAEFLSTLVDKFSLSVTALNAYLECPYKFKLDKLLRLPRAKQPHLAFGTAVHAALESFYRRLKDEGLSPSKDFLLSAFKTALAKEILTKKETANRLEQGQKILTAYYDFFLKSFSPPVFLEKFSRVNLGDITLTGKIDRIDWLDRSARSVKVVDYKTGKPKSLGHIMGKTKDSTGDLHRQLVFYKLLIDLDRRLKVNFGIAELDFVQSPAEKDKSGKLAFEITSTEVDVLKKLIREVMSDIRALKFPRTTNLETCKDCDFRDHCWPEGIAE